MGPPESVQTIFSEHTQQICEIFKFFALLITAVASPRLVLCHPQNGGKFKFCLACLRLNFKFREKFLPGQPGAHCVGHTELKFREKLLQ